MQMNSLIGMWNYNTAIYCIVHPYRTRDTYLHRMRLPTASLSIGEYCTVVTWQNVCGTMEMKWWIHLAVISNIPQDIAYTLNTG